MRQFNDINELNEARKKELLRLVSKPKLRLVLFLEKLSSFSLCLELCLASFSGDVHIGTFWLNETVFQPFFSLFPAIAFRT
jgi:hypothetical protein